jgi:hypothetical protein
MCSRTGGDAADQEKCTQNNPKLQELASARPSPLESFGSEPSDPMVRVEIVGPEGKTFSFGLRCGVFAAGGEHA